ncbi:MAG TPA: hypothetical protein VFH73_13630 [Polyangia bacterium]|jgi:hypothetical protein|nr:hypothetical protein [Polyangia bacterium]
MKRKYLSIVLKQQIIINNEPVFGWSNVDAESTPQTLNIPLGALKNLELPWDYVRYCIAAREDAVGPVEQMTSVKGKQTATGVAPTPKQKGRN